MAGYSPLKWKAQQTGNITVVGYSPQPDETLIVEDLLAGPRYAETLGIPLLQGREFNSQGHGRIAKCHRREPNFRPEILRGSESARSADQN